MKKVAFHTLGCKVNQVETEGIIEDFINKGYVLVDFNEKADIYIINTCTVTHVGDRKSKAMIRRAIRKNPLAVVAAIGCMAQTQSEELAKIKGINLVVGNSDKEDISTIIDDLARADSSQTRIINRPISVEDKPRKVNYCQKHQRTRAFIKIQDGCQNFCSYCIVPFTRGPVRSKLPADIVGEIKQLLAIGYREVVFTGINTGLYGSDLGEWNLARLLEYILAEIPGEYRMRLSSIEPLEMTAELVDIVANEDRICRHFHIPLQSGSDKVLESMHRRYRRDFYADLINHIAQKVPEAAFTTDVMVGFPEENEEDFNDTYSLLADLPITDLHVFRYSQRPGTEAATFPGQVTDQVKRQRSEKLLTLAQNKKRSFTDRFVNSDIEVLVERRFKEDHYIGLSDNYINVEFISAIDLRGSFVKLRIKTNEKMPKGELDHQLKLNT